MSYRTDGYGTTSTIYYGQTETEDASYRNYNSTESKTGGVFEKFIDFLKNNVSAFVIEVAITGLMFSDISIPAGLIIGTISATIDPLMNMAFNYFNLDHKYIKLACKVILAASIATFFISHRFPEDSTAAVFIICAAVKFIVKNFIMPRIAEIFGMRITPPEQLLTGRWGVSNLVDDEGQFHLKNFIWPVWRYDSSFGY